MQLVAVIAARGGSRRLPRKNVLPFAGLPLVEWTIIQARCSHCLTDADIYLSTDDDEIAAIGERHGIGIIRRPDWPDADQLAANVPFEHAIDEIRKQRPITHAWKTFPTTALRHPGDFDHVVSEYQRLSAQHPDCGIVRMYVPARETEVYELRGPKAYISVFDKAFRFVKLGAMVEIQTIEFHDRWNRSVWRDSDIFTPSGQEFLAQGAYYTLGKWYQAFDIDDQDSFELCELLFKRYILQGRGAEIYWEYKEGKSERNTDPHNRGTAVTVHGA